MKPVFKTLVVAGLLATAGFAAFSQNSGPMGGGMMGEGHSMGSMGKMDSSKMEAMMAKRTADLRAKLKITASQETAWAAFTTSMKPSASRMNHRPDQAEMVKLTTPERIEKMKTLRAQRTTEMNAAMDKRDEAVKTFYAQLSDEQKKVFDTESLSMGGRNHGHNSSNKGEPQSIPSEHKH
jgi:hypothetical protein